MTIPLGLAKYIVQPVVKLAAVRMDSWLVQQFRRNHGQTLPLVAAGFHSCPPLGSPTPPPPPTVKLPTSRQAYRRSNLINSVDKCR